MQHIFSTIGDGTTSGKTKVIRISGDVEIKTSAYPFSEKLHLLREDYAKTQTRRYAGDYRDSPVASGG
ncbi:MAG: hypothetical protein R3C26_19885 [Calditrichia bacterium]